MRRLPTTLALMLLLCAHAAGQQPPQGGQLAETNRKIQELAGAKKYKEAAALAEGAVEEAARLYGPDSPEVGAQLSGLGALYAARGDRGKARKALARVLELREKRPGPSREFEREALERYTCLVANDLAGRPDPSVSDRVARVFVEDSVLAQGFKLSPDRGELQVGGWVSKPQPAYPPEAKAAHASGAAVLLIDVDERGRVTGATPLGCSSFSFTGAGRDAALRVTFKPTLVGGKPVKVRSIIFYRWIIM